MHMTRNRAKARLREGSSVLCCTIDIPHPTVIEVLGYAGFHALELDREHGLIGMEQMNVFWLACEAAKVTPFWRVGSMDRAEIQRALDMGFTSFVVPHIKSAKDAESVIAAVRYPPKGCRGVGPRRPIRFGLADPVQYLQSAESELLIAFMIEEPEAVEHIDEIVAVDGVELVQLGFWDLSVAYGVPLEERHPKLVSAAEKVLEAAARKGVWVGTPPVSPEDMRKWEAKGARFFEVGSAASLLASAAQGIVAGYSPELAPAVLP